MAKSRTDAPSTAASGAAVGGGTTTQPAAPSPDARIAELEAQLAEASAAAEVLRDENEQQRQRFNAAWARREQEFEAFLAEQGVAKPIEPARGPAVGGKLVTGRKVAAGWVRAHRNGTPVTYQPGAEIHEDADLTGVHPDAIKER